MPVITSVRPISDIGEWILAALQYRYISFHVSADTNTYTVAISIDSNRTQQASETRGCIDRSEAGIPIHVPPYRCDMHNSGEAEQTSNGTPLPSMLHGGPAAELIRWQPSTCYFWQVSQYRARTSVRPVSACAMRAPCTCHVYQLALTSQCLARTFGWH